MTRRAIGLQPRKVLALCHLRPDDISGLLQHVEEAARLCHVAVVGMTGDEPLLRPPGEELRRDLGYFRTSEVSPSIDGK